MQAVNIVKRDWIQVVLGKLARDLTSKRKATLSDFVRLYPSRNILTMKHKLLKLIIVDKLSISHLNPIRIYKQNINRIDFEYRRKLIGRSLFNDAWVRTDDIHSVPTWSGFTTPFFPADFTSMAGYYAYFLQLLLVFSFTLQLVNFSCINV